MTLPDKMQAVTLRQGGYATDAIPASQVRAVDRWLEQAELPLPTAGTDQVLIKVKAAMVNPSDLAFIQGGYGQPRVEGAAAGFEGVGEVINGQGDYARSLIGQRVSFVTNGSGTWAEYAVADAATVTRYGQICATQTARP
jgi:NADPH:quinone reductase-like Zn-dependent oxidoreductase